MRASHRESGGCRSHTPGRRGPAWGEGRKLNRDEHAMLGVGLSHCDRERKHESPRLQNFKEAMGTRGRGLTGASQL